LTPSNNQCSALAIVYAGPIIDVHLHTDPPASAIGMPNPVTGARPTSSAMELRDAVIQECGRYNIVRAIMNGWPGTLQGWVDADPQRFIAAPMIMKETAHPVLDTATLRRHLKGGQAGAIGEIMARTWDLHRTILFWNPIGRWLKRWMLRS
jgi:hypothetical protein